jgi:hypothetical protein
MRISRLLRLSALSLIMFSPQVLDRSGNSNRGIRAAAFRGAAWRDLKASHFDGDDAGAVAASDYSCRFLKRAGRHIVAGLDPTMHPAVSFAFPRFNHRRRPNVGSATVAQMAGRAAMRRRPANGIPTAAG